jgi:hypothetical protein
MSTPGRGETERNPSIIVRKGFGIVKKSLLFIISRNQMLRTNYSTIRNIVIQKMVAGCCRS